MKHSTRFAGLIAGILSLMASATAYAEIEASKLGLTRPSEQVNEIIKSISIEGLKHQQNHKIWVGIGALSDLGLNKHVGLSLEGGYQFQFFGMDLRYERGSSQYGEFQVDPSSSTVTYNFPSSYDGSTEWSRTRSRSDPWGFSLFEPGISMSLKLFPEWLPSLTEKVRFGYTFGGMHDDVNSIDFSVRAASFEAGLQYEFGRGSPFSLAASLCFHTGAIIANEPESDTLQTRRLPVNWFSESLKILYWF